MSVLKVKNGNHWDIVPAIKGDTGDPAADESITDDMLVTDGIKTEIEWLWGNQLMDSREGEMLTASDAYAAPPMAVTVEGKSTQASYTGLNLWDEEWEVGGYSATSGNVWSTTDRIRSKAENYIPVLPSTTYFNRCSAVSTCCFYDASKSFISSSNGLPNATFTTPTNAAYMRFAVFPAYGTTYKHDICINVSGPMDGTYEPYTGGKPSPSPDYPQEIESADDLGLEIHGKQIMNWEHPFRTGSFYYDESIGTKFYPSSDSSVSTQIDGDNLVINIGTGWKGAVYRTPNLPSGTDCYINIPKGIHSGSGIQYGSNIYIIDKNNVVTRRPTHKASLASTSYHIILGEDEAAIVFTVGFCSSTTGTITFEKPQIELGTVATDYEPYLGNTAPLLPDGYSLRSLPNGTKDELHLSYLRPSTREGWAWYSRELVKRVGSLLFPEISWTYREAGVDSTGQAQSRFTCRLNAFGLVAAIRPTNSFCSAYAVQNTSGDKNRIFGDGTIYQLINYASLYQDGVNDSRFNNVADFLAANENTVIMSALITPTTETLDPIELPIMPSRTVNVWSDPATNLKMTYIQDSNLIIENLEATIADIATS